MTGVSPNEGSTAHGTAVTIAGTGFNGTTAVDFGTIPSAYVTVNPSGTQITANSPPQSAGSTVDITVISAAGTSPVASVDEFTYVSPPALTAISPAVGSAVGGTGVTITGTGFTETTEVDFGTSRANHVAVNSAGTQITAMSPMEAADTVDVTVIGPGGTSATSSADKFTYLGVTGVSSTERRESTTWGP